MNIFNTGLFGKTPDKTNTNPPTRTLLDMASSKTRKNIKIDELSKSASNTLNNIKNKNSDIINDSKTLFDKLKTHQWSNVVSPNVNVSNPLKSSTANLFGEPSNEIVQSSGSGFKIFGIILLIFFILLVSALLFGKKIFMKYLPNSIKKYLSLDDKSNDNEPAIKQLSDTLKKKNKNNIDKKNITTDKKKKNKEPKPSYQQVDSQKRKSAGGQNGYCYVGEEGNVRSCIDIKSSDTCMSGDIFPTMDVCINPTLRV